MSSKSLVKDVNWKTLDNGTGHAYVELTESLTDGRLSLLTRKFVAVVPGGLSVKDLRNSTADASFSVEYPNVPSGLKPPAINKAMAALPSDPVTMFGKHLTELNVALVGLSHPASCLDRESVLKILEVQGAEVSTTKVYGGRVLELYVPGGLKASLEDYVRSQLRFY